MLRSTRIFLAALCFSGFLLLFLDVSGTLPPYLAFLGKVQIVPALLAATLSGSLAVILTLVGLTLLLGRVYCSTLCPFGVMQDVISRCRGKRRFQYRPGKTALRVVVLAVFVASLLAGVPLVFGLLEPYSAFGRVATELLLPVVNLGNNALAFAAQKMDSVAVAPGPVVQKGLSALFGAVLTLGIAGWLAWSRGRTWCNTLCPVGTALGFLGRFALVRPRIHTEKCTECGRCAAACKASCINTATGSLDASRCVACFNCQGKCRHDALSFMPFRKPKDAAVRSAAPTPSTGPDLSRRAAMAGVLAGLAAVPAHATHRIKDAVIPALTRKERPARTVPITPPGSVGLRYFTARCTGCQLCVSACPNQVLRAIDSGTGMLQPTLSFEHGFCRMNCVACAAVCPTGAIRSITVEEKTAIQIGRVFVKPELCIVNTDEVVCTACARACAPGAIAMAEKGERKVPAVDNERCTGCGACEYVCPARPFAAIRVEGNVEHRRI